MLRKEKDPFQKWLQEPVCLNNEFMKRKTCIYRFITKGLVPWIQQNGYEWGVSTRTLLNCIATGLYENRDKCHIESEWPYSNVNNEFTDEEKDHFYHHLDSDMWASFWFKWGNWSDVTLETFRGPDRRLDIEEFIWGQLNLSDSPQIIMLNEILYEDLAYENDMNASPDRRTTRMDVYLQDMAEYGGYGGYRK